MTTLTREDRLRELELLPIWQLRVSKLETDASAIIPHTIELQPATTLQQAPPSLTQAAAQMPILASAHKQSIYELYQSDNRNWLFICPANTTSNTSSANPANTTNEQINNTLLNNIFVALHIKVKKYIGNLQDVDAKIMVLMGETIAQEMLNSQQSIEELRGITHLWQHLPTIVTYCCDDIVQDLANKAKTWDDLCLAMGILKP